MQASDPTNVKFVEKNSHIAETKRFICENILVSVNGMFHMVPNFPVIQKCSVCFWFYQAKSRSGASCVILGNNEQLIVNILVSL